jgi:hypothetical protein
MALLHVRWGGSATGVLITDKCHGPAGDGAIVATQCSMRWSILNTYQQKARPAGWVPGAGRESITRHAGLREALPAAIAPNASHREQKDADRATRKDQRGGNAQHVHPVGPSHGRKRRGRPYSCPWWAASVCARVYAGQRRRDSTRSRYPHQGGEDQRSALAPPRCDFEPCGVASLVGKPNRNRSAAGVDASVGVS